MMMAAAERMKDALALSEGDVFAREKLPQRGIVGDTHDRAGDFEREMQVADDPTEARRSRRIGAECDFQDRLEFLCDEVNAFVAREDSGVVGEWSLEGESELTSVFGNPTPATLGEHEAINGDTQNGQCAIPIREGGVNEFQGDQNRK
jgi:hypothetical protein